MALNGVVSVEHDVQILRKKGLGEQTAGYEPMKEQR
jgi:hypothetical protein